MLGTASPPQICGVRAKEMRQEFGYNWERAKAMLFALPLVIAYVVWRHGKFDSVDAIVVTCVVGWSVFIAFSAMCKVELAQSEIRISFALPFRTAGSFKHTDIESYTDITMERKGKKIPLAGLIKPKGWTKGIMIMGAGTKGFKELNTILIEKYPKAKDAEHQEAFSPP